MLWLLKGSNYVNNNEIFIDDDKIYINILCNYSLFVSMKNYYEKNNKLKKMYRNFKIIYEKYFVIDILFNIKDIINKVFIKMMNIF